MKGKDKKIALIVAHPDDEVLWAGGTLLLYPEWHCFIVALCRGNDPDRAPKYFEAIKLLNAEGKIADMDDGPEQIPLNMDEVKQNILDMIGQQSFDIVITHGQKGEYSRHQRHEEVSKAVSELWFERKIETQELWQFAYQDGNGSYLPRANEDANLIIKLPEHILLEKRKLLTNNYGFDPMSWEVRTTPETEAFYCFKTFDEYLIWEKENIINEPNFK